MSATRNRSPIVLSESSCSLKRYIFINSIKTKEQMLNLHVKWESASMSSIMHGKGRLEW